MRKHPREWSWDTSPGQAGVVFLLPQQCNSAYAQQCSRAERGSGLAPLDKPPVASLLTSPPIANIQLPLLLLLLEKRNATIPSTS